MPDRDDIFGRYWLNYRCGNIDAAEKTAGIASDLLEKGRLYDGLKQTLYCQTSYRIIHQAMTAAEGRADLEARMVRSEESPPAGPSGKAEGPASLDFALDTKMFIEYRYAGHTEDPLSGVAMRRTIKGGQVAFHRNLTKFWQLKAAAHRRGINSALILPLPALAMQISLSFIQSRIGEAGGFQALGYFGLAACTLPLLFPAVTYAIGTAWLAGARADHEKWTNGVSVSRRNARQIATDMAGQKAATLGLIDEILDQASYYTDEARLHGRLAEAPDEKAFHHRLARWLADVLTGQYDYQRICHYLMELANEGIESTALYRAFYFPLGPAIRIRRTFVRHLALAALAMVSVGWTVLHRQMMTNTPATICALAGLGACLLSILQAARLTARFDRWMAERLPASFIAEITGGGPSSGPSPDAHYEHRRTRADHAATTRILAREERRRR